MNNMRLPNYSNNLLPRTDQQQSAGQAAPADPALAKYGQQLQQLKQTLHEHMTAAPITARPDTGMPANQQLSAGQAAPADPALAKYGQQLQQLKQTLHEHMTAAPFTARPGRGLPANVTVGRLKFNVGRLLTSNLTDAQKAMLAAGLSNIEPNQDPELNPVGIASYQAFIHDSEGNKRNLDVMIGLDQQNNLKNYLAQPASSGMHYNVSDDSNDVMANFSPATASTLPAGAGISAQHGPGAPIAHSFVRSSQISGVQSHQADLDPALWPLIADGELRKMLEKPMPGGKLWTKTDVIEALNTAKLRTSDIRIKAALSRAPGAAKGEYKSIVMPASDDAIEGAVSDLMQEMGIDAITPALVNKSLKNSQLGAPKEKIESVMDKIKNNPHHPAFRDPISENALKTMLKKPKPGGQLWTKADVDETLREGNFYASDSLINKTLRRARGADKSQFNQFRVSKKYKKT